MTPAGEPTGHLAYGDPAERPRAGPVGLHRDVDHDARQAGVGEGDLPVQQVLQHQDLARATGEPAQAERAGTEHHGIRVDRDDPAHRDEDAPAQRQLGDEPDHVR